MKIKSVVTGCNRKQLRVLVLNQKAKVESLTSELNQERSKNESINRLLDGTKDKLIIKSASAEQAIALNKELEETNRNLLDKVDVLERKLVSSNTDNNNLCDKVLQLSQANDRQAKLINELEKELAFLKRPLWRKVFSNAK